MIFFAGGSKLNVSLKALLALLLLASQGNLASARTAYSKCVGAFTRSQIKEAVEEPAFRAKLATACKAEEAAFRAASVAFDVAAKVPRATAEANAQDEIDYIHENAIEMFRAALAPQGD